MARECPECGISFEWGAAWASHMRNKHPDAAVSGEDPPSGSSNGSTTEGPEEVVVEPDLASAQVSEPATPEGGTAEKVPQAHPETPTERAKSLVARLRTPRPKTRTRAPRKSTAELWEFAWGQSGGFLMATNRYNFSIPVGRVLALQAPIVGDIIDDVVADTFVDPALQWAMRGGDKMQKLGAVVLPPILVGVMAENPEAARWAMPMLRPFVLTMLAASADKAKKVKAEEKKLMKALEAAADIFPPELLEEAKARGVHPADVVIGSFFAPLGEEQTAPPEAEPAVA